jgi:hypothetical protein
MKDVDEVYKIPIVCKSTNESNKDSRESQSSNKELDLLSNKLSSDLCLTSPLVDLKTTKFTILHRHINQILVRGDNIVMVAYAD